MTVGAEAAPAGAAALPTAGLAHRMAAFVYEGVLLFGVVFMAGLVYSSLTQQRHALQGQTGLQVVVFVVLGLYFVTFWTRGGQTVAMRAWQVRLVDASNQPVTPARAVARYVASWLWFAPALVTARLAGLHSATQIFTLLAVGVLAYALLTRLHPQRQFLHDALCGTRLVHWRPAPPRRAQFGR
jgi:uncharacterized RDD family membrane protein YckC